MAEPLMSPATTARAVPVLAPARKTITWSVALIASFDVIASTVAAVAGSYDDALALAFPIMVLAVLACTGGFSVGLALAALDWAPWLVQRVGLTALLLAPAALWLGDARQLLVVALITVPALVLARALSFMVLRRWRRAGLLDRALIIGAGRVGAQLGEIFLEHR